MKKLNENVEEYFGEFYDYFADYIRDDAATNEDVIESLAERQLDGNWDVRTWYHEPHMLALNVKYKGQGDWDKFNKDGRAEKMDYSAEDYYNMINMNQSDYFNDWADTFKEELGLDLYCGGRSGGWWGFKIDDFSYSSFVVDKEKVRKLFDEKANTLLLDSDEDDEDMQELAYDLSNEVDISEYLSFEPEFVNLCNQFSTAINSDSEWWESDEWNDDKYQNEYDWRSMGESKKDNSKRMTENDKYIGDVASFKKEINALCEWAVQDYGDRDALFFGAGYDGYLIKGRMLDFYVDEIIDNSSSPDEEELESMENDGYEVDNNDKEGLQKSGDIKSEAFANLVNDYQDATGVHFNYKIINPHDGEFCIIEIEEK